MKAVVHDRYGPPEVLRVEDVERPEPKDDEVLVRVHATTVTRTDCHMRAARPFIWRFMLGLRRPKRRILGVEFAGQVEAVGPAVTRYRIGDRVFGAKGGSHAEYVCVRENGVLAHIPDGLTFEQATVTDGFHQGLGPLRRANVGPGTRLVVYGASGSCGTAAVQLAKHHFGAHVTAVCNTKNVELVRSLGPDEVLDYTRGEDCTKRGEIYDVVLDAVGRHSLWRSRKALVPHGLFLATDRLYNFPLAFLTRLLGRRKVVFTVERPTREDQLLLAELLEAGTYRPVIDRAYPLVDVVEATKYVESFQKAGNVVLTVRKES